MRNYLYVFSFLLSCSFYGQSKIDKSKNDLNGRNRSSRQNSNDSRRSSNSQNSGTYFDNDGDFWIYVIPKIVFFSFIGNHQYEQHLENKVTDYPYYNGESGNYENSDWSNKNFRLDMEDNLLFSSNTLYGNHLKVKIRPFHYFYFQGDMHHLFEKNDFDNTTDRLSVYFFNAGYDRIRMEKFNFGWTMGASYIGNEVKKAGFSFGLNTEIFIGHNLSVSAAAKWSIINGYSVDLYDIQTRYHKERFFGSLGFEHMQIGTPNYNFISLGGGIYLN